MIILVEAKNDGAYEIPKGYRQRQVCRWAWYHFKSHVEAYVLTIPDADNEFEHVFSVETIKRNADDLVDGAGNRKGVAWHIFCAWKAIVVSGALIPSCMGCLRFLSKCWVSGVLQCGYEGVIIDFLEWQMAVRSSLLCSGQLLKHICLSHESCHTMTRWNKRQHFKDYCDWLLEHASKVSRGAN